MLRNTMKIASPSFKTLFTPELQQLSELFGRYNYELRIAGGAVRDLLMDLKPIDVDFASTATPTQMKTLFEKEGIRMLNKKGEEHGTITCRLNDKENFEITTLRIDVVCDGRRAEVKFTTNWELDAFRRDLTINSLFLGLDGTIYDYTGGIDDVKNRRISFVGNPVQRLEEDYLRILRYFRFFGRIANSPIAHESENIQAIIKCKDGLKNVSGERIWSEIQKILVGRFATEIIEVMLNECKLAECLALSQEHIDKLIAEFRRVATANIIKESGKVNCEPATMFSALALTLNDVEEFRLRAKVSNAEYALAKFIVTQRTDALSNRNNIDYFKHLLLDLIFDGGCKEIHVLIPKVIKSRFYYCRVKILAEIKPIALKQCEELLKYINAPECLKVIQQWDIALFPVHGLDLMNVGIKKGKRMRAVLKYLFELWKESNLKLSKEDLLEHSNDKEEIDKIEESLSNAPKQKKRKPNS